MELNYFKEKLFDVLNETDEMEIADIDTKDSANIHVIRVPDGSIFEIESRKIK